MELQGKVVAITGGGKGIGRAIALRLAAQGAKLALLDLDEEAMTQTCDLVKEAGSEARGYICNVADEAAVETTFNQIVADFNSLHGVVNNAGILRDAQLIKVKDGKVVKKMTADNYSLVVDVHMKGAFLCAREAAAHMVELGVEEGCIVNMSSIAYRGNFGQSNYSAAKAGIVAQSKVWAKELGRYNIRSMAIAPGTIDTELLRSMPEDALNAIAAGIPLKRIGDVDNIAQTVQHIFENNYLSGDVIEVSGGVTL
ncbi:SDR family oxidoreductase [Pseudomaricurvus alkylphenolicus]|uniref:SDR family oxidoreductase n=1 Tax=Pseudomaricurvus alkylphenolicus TaxID=1306991 RepID=UPI00141E6951|nr:SDR family oxidoreductase [Pseudomaricurvus alkylphenolicus]NIB44600.1 SDR family oxidoreductase [Pseudomaricurvus alkylphenolicus]